MSDQFIPQMSNFSKLRIEIAVTYSSADADGFPFRHDLDVQAAYDAPLLHSLRESSLPINSSDLLNDVQCFEGHSKGKKVDLRCIPLEVSYLTQALKNDTKPVLFLVEKNEPDDVRTGRDSGICCDERSSDVRSYHMSSKMVRRMQNRIASTSEDEFHPITQTSFSPDTTKSSMKKAVSFNSNDKQLIDDQETPDIFSKKKSSTLTHLSSLDTYPLGSQLHKLFHSQTVLNIDDSLHPQPFFPRRPFVRKPVLRSRESRGSISAEFKVQVVMEGNDWSVQLDYNASETVRNFRAAISEEMRDNWLEQSIEAKPLVLTYSVEGMTYELLNPSQYLYFSFFHKSSEVPRKIVAKFTRSPDHKERSILFRITQLTCVVLDKVVFLQGNIPVYRMVASPDKSEVTLARRTLYEFVSMVTSTRNTEEYSLSPEVMTGGAPPIISLKIPITNQLAITFHFEDVFSYTKSIHIYATATKVLEEVFPCVLACGLVGNDVSKYAMQVSGEDSYIHGNHEIISFKDIRDCIAKGDPIHLSIVKRPNVELYNSFTMDKPLLDPSTRSVPHHYDLINMDSSVNSSWNINDNLRVKVKHVDNLNLSQGTESLSVEVSLHLGAINLSDPQSTSKKLNISFTATWDETLEFNIKICDVPKEAKFLIILRDFFSLTYFWGLLPVFNHESRLSSGISTLHLWKAVMNSPEKTSKKRKPTISSRSILELEGAKLSSILAGPAANNPDAAAIRAVLEIIPSESTVEVIYPSTSKESRSSFFTLSGRKDRKLYQHFLAHLKLKFSSASRTKENYSDLPKHLKAVNWDNLLQRLEVYELLEELENCIDDIPTHVAFTLLDCEFPDENVRSFATKVLDKKLVSDNLPHYLLQLVQALKFEPFHDSALVRLLLNRALQDKKIGHLFFWFLRCEMDCSQYVPRFSVILEAYLTGCGDAMINRFKDQLEVQNLLQGIGKKLREDHGKDQMAMQAALPRALKKAQLDRRAFFPVSNPRLVVGRMRPEKSKILSSAKRPMWLELMNVSRSVATIKPIKLIMKMGDDLRQDMITLRMLALFDKLWQNEGLDLKLISYGCMATGYNSGFIEVVKNSKTISEVSGVTGSKKLYQWIKSHQLNEFGEVDKEKLDKAIKTFVHSCAGYSVATYTLGIGDRHNDNIMITTSGNLFHIDFGHFLGNIKYFMGFKKEWAPFVLTPDFIYAMGGENSENFELYRRLCFRAFMILRRNADLIINLFSIMRSTGIPELTCVEDTHYIKDALVLDMSELEAEQCFQNVIRKCIDLGWTVQVVWYIHKLRHAS